MLIRDITDLITKYNDGSPNEKLALRPRLEKLVDLKKFYDKGKDKYIRIPIPLAVKYILADADWDNIERCDNIAKDIFDNYFDFNDKWKAKINIFENLIAESIYCLIDIAQLVETMDETYLFPHSFLGSIHEHLSFWIRLYEAYETYKSENPDIEAHSHIEEYLEQYLDEEWREQLSGYRGNELALSHYYKCLEMHNEGRAYYNMLDIMCYIKDDFNDRSDHFNIAEERHLIVNDKIKKKINSIKDIYKDSGLYDEKNYFEKFSDRLCTDFS